MIVLGVHVLQLEERIEPAQDFGVQPEFVHMRAAGQVSVDHDFERVVPQGQLVEIPEVVVGLVIEIQAVQPFYPADLDLYVERGPVDAFVLPAVVPHLLDSHGIAVGDHVPVGEVSVYSGNHVLRELENLKAGFGDLNFRGRARDMPCIGVGGLGV